MLLGMLTAGGKNHFETELLQAMSHTPPLVLQPPGWDCVTV